MATDASHEMIFALHKDSFQRELRCKHVENGEACAPDLSIYEANELYDWPHPKTPSSKECFFEEHLFGMSDTLIYSDNGEHTMFSTRVRVLDQATFVLEENPGGEANFSLEARCESPEFCVDGKFVSSVDIPISVIMVYPIEWVNSYGYPSWKSVAPHRILRPGDVEWDAYEALLS